jgi:AcrR family transcriptional regulator
LTGSIRRLPIADQTRDRILETAGRLFAEKGFKATTVRDVCREAGVNLQAIAYHFGGKAQLHVESVRYALARCHEGTEIPDLFDGMSPEDKLRQVIRGLYLPLLTADDQRQPPWCAPLVMRELSQPTPVCAGLVEEFIRPKHDLLFAIVQELRPDFDEVARHLAVFSLVGQLMFHRLNRTAVQLLLGPKKAQQLTVDRIIDHITQFTLAALRNADSEFPEDAR